MPLYGFLNFVLYVQPCKRLQLDLRSGNRISLPNCFADTSQEADMRIQARFSRLYVLTTALLALIAVPAAAQVDTGAIRGTVRDQSGGVLPGATVTVTHEGQGFKLTGVTREDGTYIFTPIRTGDRKSTR